MTITLIRQLQSMQQARDDPRSLRNNLNDIQAIIAALQKQGETVDSTSMINMVLQTFSKPVQREIAKKEFDSGKTWNMSELLDNISTVRMSSSPNPKTSEQEVFKQEHVEQVDEGPIPQPEEGETSNNQRTGETTESTETKALQRIEAKLDTMCETMTKIRAYIRYDMVRKFSTIWPHESQGWRHEKEMKTQVQQDKIQKPTHPNHPNKIKLVAAPYQQQQKIACSAMADTGQQNASNSKH
ncbi:hypothetical protein ANCCAN_11434 [Ancylostoma caninum]|uniref:Uncharacterized protein n=1 Tax=Ancylostoma caninum TaxID=29170 RepID=A0A368GDT8_ANCCA|nr:hypothetical protein ANCCAN_11434 [Ancylostoma caninum]